MKVYGFCLSLTRCYSSYYRFNFPFHRFHSMYHWLHCCQRMFHSIVIHQRIIRSTCKSSMYVSCTKLDPFWPFDYICIWLYLYIFYSLLLPSFQIFPLSLYIFLCPLFLSAHSSFRHFSLWHLIPANERSILLSTSLLPFNWINLLYYH